MAGKQEVDTVTTGAVSTRGTVDSFVNYLQRLASENTESRSFDVASSQIERLLDAETVDEILDADEQGTLQARDLVGFELTVNPIDFKTSVHKSDEKYNSPLGVYIQFSGTALIDFTSRGIAKGDDVLISTGAPLIIAKLRVLAAGGHLPMPLMIAGIDAPNGTVLKLRRVPSRA